MATKPRTRLAPDARRAEILEHARQLFGARSYAAVSASEIARAAGVTPALVSHYFPAGKRDIFLTLIAQLTENVLETIRADPAKPIRERVAATTENWLDWLQANSETWLATAAQGDYIADRGKPLVRLLQLLLDESAVHQHCRLFSHTQRPNKKKDPPTTRGLSPTWIRGVVEGPVLHYHVHTQKHRGVKAGCGPRLPTATFPTHPGTGNTAGGPNNSEFSTAD